MIDLLGYLLLALVALWSGVLLAFAQPLLARWREPVLRRPVLVIESDDWGAGPWAQAEALRAITVMLRGIRDRDGRPALMTLGVVFEVPDGPRIAATNPPLYHPLPLTDPRFDDVRAAMLDGVSAGVFVPQLHGQSHYWPPALMAAAQRDDAVRQWLTAPEPATTEQLPSHLQSRWVDASTLPSTPLASDAIDAAVAWECDSFTALFGEAPKVAVATTFVWSVAVEQAWARAGIEVIITPGRRATCRDATGAPGCIDRTMLTGDRSAAGRTYLVRDIYFEPIRGHDPEQLAKDLAARARQGRACLVETHRINFIRARAASLAALEQGLRSALAACPATAFLSPRALAIVLRSRDPAWLEFGIRRRVAIWCARVDEISRFRRAARWSGLAWALRCARLLLTTRVIDTD